MTGFRGAFLAVLPCLALAGCYAPGAEVALSPDLDRASLHTVAIRPFADRGSLPAGGVTLSRAFEAGFLERGVRVVPYERVREALARATEGAAAGDDGWTADTWRRVHEDTGVDAVLNGTVTASEFVPGGMPPYLMECSFRLVAASGGEVLASGNANEDGPSAPGTASQLARRVLVRFFGDKSAAPMSSRWPGL